MKKTLLLILGFMAGTASAVPSFEPNTCVQDKKDYCIDATPCKNISGVTACLAGTTNPPANSVMLTETCWQWQAAFTCTDTASIGTCQPLRDRGCGQVNTQCISYDDTGTKCMSSTQTFQCPDKPATVKETNVCDTSLCQADGTGCFSTTRPADKDFGQAAAMMEASREAGVYGVNGSNIEIFKGYMEECSVKTLGGSDIKSCCTAAGGGAGFTNYAVIGVTAKAAYAVGKEELKAGSKYMYDALFSAQDASLVQEGASAAAGGLSSGAAEGVAAQAGTNFGAYGFEFSYSSAGGFSYVGFDPYSFAFAVAVAIITEWLSCDQEEQVMQMKRGQNLCVYINSYCSSKTLGVCTEKKERHCCFASVLAKIINRQGRAQLGMPMDQCGGFTQEQIQSIDFSTIDFSEFIATINPTSPDQGGTTSTVTDTVNKKVKDYYGP